MKIAIVTGEYPPMQGGVGDYSHLMAQTFAEQGHTIHVVTSPPALASQTPAITVTPLSSRAWSLRDVLRVRRAVAGCDLVNIQYQAAAYGKMRPPIHLLPRLAAPPTVMTFHDLRVPYLFPKAGRLRWQAILEMARSADGVIVTNPEDYRTLYGDPRIPHLADIPIGSNIYLDPPPDYTPQQWRAEHDIAPGEWLLGYFGFLNPSKGGKTLVQALAGLRQHGHPARLVLVGGRTGTADTSTNAAYGDEVDQLAAELGLSQYIFRTGFLPPQQTSAALLSCDLMIQPYRDGASFRRGTFMACLNHGRPTITTQPAVPLDQLRHGENIWLVPPDDAAGVVAAVVGLMADAATREQIGQGALQLSEDFTWGKIAEAQVAFFGRVLGGIARHDRETS